MNNNIKILATFLIILLLVISGYYLVTKTTQVEQLVKIIIQKKFNNSIYQLSVDKIKLDFSNYRLNVIIKDLIITKRANKQLVLDVAQISLKIKLKNIVTNKALINHANIQDPIIYYNSQINYEFKQPLVDYQQLSQQTIVTLLKWQSKLIKLPIKKLIANNIKLINSDKANNHQFISNLSLINKVDLPKNQQVDIIINKNHQQLNLTLKTNLKTNRTNLIINFNDLLIDNLNQYFNDSLTNYSLKLVVSGQLIANFSDQKLLDAKLNLNNYSYGYLNIDNKQFIIESLPVNLKFEQDFKQAKLTSTIKLIDQTVIELEINALGLKAFEAHIQTTNISIAQLIEYWPPQIKSNNLEFLKKKLNQGMINSASLLIDCQLADQLIINQIEGKINLTQARLTNYYLDTQPIEQIEAEAIFNLEDIKVIIKDAKFLSSRISNTKITIPHIKQDIKLALESDGPLEDLIDLLPTKLTNNFNQYNLRDFKGQFALKLDHLFISKNPKLNKFNIKLDVNNFSAKLNQQNLQASRLQLKFTEQELMINTAGYLADEAFTFQVLSNYLNQPVITKINSSFNANLIHYLSKINLPITGELDLRVEANSQLITSIELDLTRASIDISEIGLNKKINQAATLSTNLETKADKSIKLSNLQFISDDYNITGCATIDSTNWQINQLQLDQINNQDNDFNLYYQNLINNKKLIIQGKSLMINLKNNYNLANKSVIVKEEFNDLLLIINLESLSFNQHKVQNLEGNLKFINQLPVGELGFRFNQTNFVQANFELQENNSKINLLSNNISELIKLFQPNSTIEYGILNLQANYHLDDTLKTPVIEGILKVNDFKIINSPALAKLLIMTSLSGLTNLASKVGEIPFELISSDFIFKDNRITISSAKASGPNIGFTTEGNININTKTLNLHGTIIPDLMFINKLIASFPVLGKILQGGDDGFFAANYRIYGSFANLHTFVNPLSLLTPGFTRKIFNPFAPNKKN